MDKLFILRPESFDYSFEWRLEAEKKAGKGMSDEQIKSFVRYFLEAIDPELYYSQLYQKNPEHLALEFLMDSQRHVQGIRGFK